MEAMVLGAQVFGLSNYYFVCLKAQLISSRRLISLLFCDLEFWVGTLQGPEENRLVGFPLIV